MPRETSIETKFAELKARAPAARGEDEHRSGHILNGLWRSHGKTIGRGRYGIVYLGERLSDGQPIAYKRSKDHVGSTAEAIKTAEETHARETQLLRRLDHPHIVRIYDSFLQATDMCAPDEPFYFNVMELLEGRTAWDAITGNGDARMLSEEEVVGFAREAASAFAHGQEQGIVHRDGHPGNFMLETPRGTVVMDYGIGKILDKDFHTVLKESVAGEDLIKAQYLDLLSQEGDPSFSTDTFSTVRVAAALRQGTHVRGEVNAQDYRFENGAVAELFARNASFNPADRSKDAPTFLDDLANAENRPVQVAVQEEIPVQKGLSDTARRIRYGDERIIYDRDGTHLEFYSQDNLVDRVRKYQELLLDARIQARDTPLRPEDYVQLYAFAMDMLRSEEYAENTVAQRMLRDESLKSIIDGTRKQRSITAEVWRPKEYADTERTMEDLDALVGYHVDSEHWTTRHRPIQGQSQKKAEKLSALLAYGRQRIFRHALLSDHAVWSRHEDVVELQLNCGRTLDAIRWDYAEISMQDFPGNVKDWLADGLGKYAALDAWHRGISMATTFFGTYGSVSILAALDAPTALVLGGGFATAAGSMNVVTAYLKRKKVDWAGQNPRGPSVPLPPNATAANPLPTHEGGFYHLDGILRDVNTGRPPTEEREREYHALHTPDFDEEAFIARKANERRRLDAM